MRGGFFMAGVQKSLRLPPETMKEIEQMAKETGQDFSNVTKDLLQEAIKMRRCPGILFSEGTSGRRARVAGTGIHSWGENGPPKNVKGGFQKAAKGISLAIRGAAQGGPWLLYDLSPGD